MHYCLTGQQPTAQRGKVKMSSTFDKFRDSVVRVHEELKRIEIAHALLSEDISELEKLGVVNATPQYKNEKYLYLVHPFGAFQRKNKKTGEMEDYRKHEYIGRDEEKIADAYAKVERFDKWRKLTAERSELEERISLLNVRISSVLSELSWIKK